MPRKKHTPEEIVANPTGFAARAGVKANHVVTTHSGLISFARKNHSIFNASISGTSVKAKKLFLRLVLLDTVGVSGVCVRYAK